MGRILAKRFFGNTNTGGLAGDAVASVTVAGTNNAYIVKPTLTFADPTLPGGTTATGTARMAVIGITNHTSGTGMTPLQVLTLTGGTGVKGTIRVDTTSLATVTLGTAHGTGYTTGDVVTIQGGTGTLGTATVIASAGIVTGFSTFTPGSYTVNPTTLTDAATVKVGGGGDDALQVNITMGANTTTLLTGGDYSVLPADVTIVGSGSGNPLFNLTFKVLRVEITSSGSGYSGAPTVTESAPDGNATFTAVLTTTGADAIVAYAFVTGSSKVADIVKQTGTRRYLVNNADTAGTPVVAYLKASAATALGEMTIAATDAGAGEYFVTKLTAHKAVVRRAGGSGWAFEDGAQVAWTFGTANATTVKIQNA